MTQVVILLSDFHPIIRLMKVKIIGLGNTKKYSGTKHNIGRDFVIRLVKDKKLSFINIKKNLMEAKEEESKKHFSYYISESYINCSGSSFKEVFKTKPVLIVVHDELDLPIGKYKFSFAKNDAGHNGVKSIIKKIRTKDFYRFRIGVGSKEKINDKAKYVLSEFNKNAKDDLDKVFLNFKKTLEEFDVSCATELKPKKYFNELFGLWSKN